MKVVDAFGKPLHIGDTVCWIGDPSVWKVLRKGILLQIEEKSHYFYNTKPELTVRAFPLEEVHRNAILHTCTRCGEDKWKFTRLVKLNP